MYPEKRKHAFKVFSQDVKNDSINKINLMYGKEQYLVKWAVETIAGRYVNPASKAMDYVILDDEEATVDAVMEAAETFSMFSEKRVIWVRNFRPLSSDSARGYGKSDLERLASYLEGSNDGAVLIFSGEDVKAKTIVTTALKKFGTVYDFDTLDRADLTSFAAKRFRSAGVEISQGGMRALIESTGYYNRDSDYRLYNFENDISKIISHSDGVRVTEDDVMSCVSGDADTFVFDMLDGISSGQKDRAFSIMHNILGNGGEVFSLIGAIVSQFELMLSVRQMRDDGMNTAQITKTLGASEYRIKKLMPYVNRYSQYKLKQILSSAYETDRNIKTGLLDQQLALEMFAAGIWR